MPFLPKPSSSSIYPPRRVSTDQIMALHGVEASRRLEGLHLRKLPAHTLMARAGLSVARLSMAISPHAQNIWVACGPGNNGGDGLEAAAHLHRWGKTVHLSWLGSPEICNADVRQAWAACDQAGLPITRQPPAQTDLVIDALLGLGASRPPDGILLDWVRWMNGLAAPILSVDLPTGLNADTGALLGSSDACVRASHCLSLLTLKPGLFTSQGREQCGEIWLDDLQTASQEAAEDAVLWGCDRAIEAGLATDAQRLKTSHPAHASHKGSYGDVCVLGGAVGMEGAAWMAAQAALRAGAGRVYLGMLGYSAPWGPTQADLMMRPPGSLDLRSATVVCGCGGGTDVMSWLDKALEQSPRLVLDADALNALARTPEAQTALKTRAQRGLPSILTPHPLEAARLLRCSVPEVQADRLAKAQELAESLGCIVVLKGSGTVVAAPGLTPIINSSGDARLATAGTGDLLAGMLGGCWSARNGTSASTSLADLQSWVAQTVWSHGRLPDHCPSGRCAGDFLQHIPSLRSMR